MTAADWVKLLSANLGLAGAIFFLLYTGIVPSPLIARLEAHDAQMQWAAQEQTKTLKLQCAILAHVAKLPEKDCYYPPEGPPQYRTHNTFNVDGSARSRMLERAAPAPQHIDPQR